MINDSERQAARGWMQREHKNASLSSSSFSSSCHAAALWIPYRHATLQEEFRHGELEVQWITQHFPYLTIMQMLYLTSFFAFLIFSFIFLLKDTTCALLWVSVVYQFCVQKQISPETLLSLTFKSVAKRKKNPMLQGKLTSWKMHPPTKCIFSAHAFMRKKKNGDSIMEVLKLYLTN